MTHAKAILIILLCLLCLCLLCVCGWSGTVQRSQEMADQYATDNACDWQHRCTPEPTATEKP